MKILFLALGDETVASSRTRVFQYLPYLRRRNINFRVLVYTKHNWLTVKGIFKKIENVFHSFFILSRVVALCPFYDVIFVQKVLLCEAYLRLLRCFGKKLIFDFDDAVYIPHQSVMRSIAFRAKKRVASRWFRQTVAASDLIVIVTEHARSYVEEFNKNIIRIAGPIDTLRYYQKHRVTGDKRDIVIGWIGSPPNTVYLEPLFPVFRRLSRVYPDMWLKFIGAAPIDAHAINIRQVEWKLETEVRELQEFDIGIMPLPDDEWSMGKGGYKLLQYMAVGIPSVASPVGINGELIKDGENGFLARGEEEWYAKLSLLISSAEIRRAMGAKGRSIVEKEYSLSAAGPLLVNAMSDLCSRKL